MKSLYRLYVLKKLFFLFFIICSSLYAEGTTTIIKKSFYYIRHGETDWNKLNKPMGKKDIPLNETGKLQANAIAPFFSLIKVKEIDSSSLKRAYETATIINQKLSLPLRVYDGLMERDVFESTNEKDEIVYEHEEWDSFKNRVLETMNSILATPTEDPVLIVAHGGVFSALMDLIGEPTFYIRNCEPFYLKAPENGQTKWQIYRLFTHTEMK